MIYKLEDLNTLSVNIKIPCLIFLKGDLWAGKTTLSKHILKNQLWIKEDITSPTYTYYNKYIWKIEDREVPVYHFDLYRLQNYDEFIAIWWEEVFDNNAWVIIVEWSELVKDYYKPDIKIVLKNLWKEDERDIEVF